MKMRKKVLSIMVSAVLAAGLCPSPAFAQGGEALSAAVSSLKALDGHPVASGTWGTCPWELDATGKLTVHPGVGADTEYCSPWGDHAGSIKSVVFAQEGGNKVVAPACCAGLFQGLDNLASIDLSGLDTSNVTDMGSMFRGCSALKSLNLKGFDTSKVRDMGP